MNAAKLSPNISPKTQTRSRPGLQEGLLQGEITSANKNIKTPPPHVSQLAEWIDLSSSGSSMQDLHEEFLDEGVPQMVRTKNSGVGSEDEDDMRSTITKREDKYLKRRLKNERNYKDLNKSLANLALKRENRSTSSDNNTLLYNSQNQTQTDKSHNFEFQPPFCSPAHGPKNFSATTNHTNVHPYISSGFQSKNLSGFSQYSPQKLSPRSQYSPQREKPAYKMEVKPCEPEFAKVKNVTPKRNYYQNSRRTNSPHERNDLPVIQGAVQVKEYRGLQDPWLNSKITFFPGNMEKLEQLSELLTEENSNDITPRMANESRTVSFKDLMDIKDRKPVLDSKLPSKIDLSEKLSTRETDDACTVQDKMSILGEEIGQVRFRDDSISGSVGGFIVKSRPQEEEKFEQVEKRTLDVWKKDLLQIRNEMEMRQKNYQEINNFVKMCENMDKPERNANSSRLKASIFSSPAQIKNEGNNSSRSSRILTSIPSQKHRSTPIQSSPLSKTFLATERTKSPMTRLEKPGTNSEFRGNKGNNMNQSYFRFNNENNNSPNISSFYRDRSQDRSKVN